MEDVYKLGEDLGKKILLDMGKEQEDKKNPSKTEYEQEKMFNEYLNSIKNEQKEENIINWNAVLNKISVDDWPIEHILHQEFFDDNDIRNLKKIMVSVLSRMKFKAQQELFWNIRNL